MSTIQKNINLQLHKGEFVGILGKNGIGKSTLLRTLTGVQDAISGEVFIQGKNIQSYNLKELSGLISLVLTERLPDSQLTVYEIVALGRQPYTNWIGRLEKNDIDKINWALDQTETMSLANRHFNELSDGQLQRVLIARALAQDTQMIMLDEPSAALAPQIVLDIFKNINRIRKDGLTVLVVEQNVRMALLLSDYGYVIKDGIINVEGESKKLMYDDTVKDSYLGGTKANA